MVNLPYCLLLFLSDNLISETLGLSYWPSDSDSGLRFSQKDWLTLS